MSLRAPVLLALLAGAALAQSPPAPGAPAPQGDELRAPLSERLGWNARERTASGAKALARGNSADARQALDSALRLRPDDPASRYNAGTGRLAEGDPSAGVLLELAAREAPPELAPSAWYNLGEARLAAREFRGAADAFVESLKRRPEHAGAKQNLELALRELQKQKQQQDRQQKEQEQKSDREEQDDEKQSQAQKPSEDENGNDEPRSQRDSSDNQEKGDGQPKDEQGRPKQDEPRGKQPEPGHHDPSREPKDPPSSLPQFRDLPDMSADQAAAILRAVENLERQQRKERAAKAAKAARAAVEIDW